MRLQRTAVYRATRILSWVLPVVIFVFLGIAAWSYWVRTHNAQPRVATSDELPTGVAVRTNDVQYVVSVSGRDQFQVRAKQMLVSKDNRSLLTGVEVFIYAQKPGDPDRRIRGDECHHDKQTEQVDCNRNVSVELEPGTIARTEQLYYDPKRGLISSNVQTTLDRKDEMTGTAGKMDYFVDTGVMHLTQNFVIKLTQGGGMRGATGIFQYKENWATVSGGMELTSTNGRIYGGSGRAELAPGTYRVKKITVDGGAGADAPAFVVNSDWLQGDLSNEGSIEHVLGRGNVHAEHRSTKENNSAGGGGDALTGTLTGPEVEAWLEGGRMSVVEARQRPEFTSASGKLNATEKIRIEPAGSKAGRLQTEGLSTFNGDALAIDGRNFLMTVAEDEQVFNTDLRATLRSSGLTTVADKTEVHLDPKTKMVTTMQQIGKVTFEEDESGRKGAAGKLTVRNAGDIIELEGDKPSLPSFNDSQGILNSRKITFDRKTESFTGNGDVRMISSGTGGKPVTVYAAHVEGTQSRIDYSGNVQMYSGDGKIEGDRVTVYPKENRFEAEGRVHSQTAELQVWSAGLQVKDSGRNQQVAHYTRNVRAVKRDGMLDLRSQDLTVNLRSGEKGGQVDTIIATGGVSVTQATRTGRGDRMEYNVATKEMLLVGTNASEAEVRERGTDEFVKGCSITVRADGSKAAKPCSDRGVTSSIKVNKN
jgi:LPS export ABC transporter protein LptC